VLAFALLVSTLLAPSSSGAVTKNGFDLANASVDARDIVRGGPPRDGIVALTEPEFVTATEAELKPDARILGVRVSGITKAYPIRMLTVHEIVNDVVGEQYFAVTYCPLCGSGVVFATNVANTHLNFGVSGLLYNSDVLMYDRNTESLWSQLGGASIAGPLVGTKLPLMPVWHTTWAEWRSRHPGTLVMRGEPQFAKAYRTDPYPGYERTRRLYYPVEHRAPKTYHPKERVLGFMLNGVAKAYPFAELDRLGADEFTDTVGGVPVLVRWDAEAESAEALDHDGRSIPATTLYWFAWFAFHPDTEVFAAERRE
jgi:hypothetical protein